jgi:hypothetical protein
MAQFEHRTFGDEAQGETYAPNNQHRLQCPVQTIGNTTLSLGQTQSVPNRHRHQAPQAPYEADIPVLQGLLVKVDNRIEPKLSFFNSSLLTTIIYKT